MDAFVTCPPAPRRLRPIIAIGAAPLLPGAGHFYARRPVIGALIVGAFVAFFVVLAGGPRRQAAAVLWLVGIVVFDAAGEPFPAHLDLSR